MIDYVITYCEAQKKKVRLVAVGGSAQWAPWTPLSSVCSHGEELRVAKDVTRSQDLQLSFNGVQPTTQNRRCLRPSDKKNENGTLTR